MTEKERIKIQSCFSNGADFKELHTEEMDSLAMALQDALFKQIPKKPILCMHEKSVMFADYADGHGECKIQMNNWWKCPCCNSVVGQRVIVRERVHDQRKKKYCEECGQAIDWQT